MKVFQNSRYWLLIVLTLVTVVAAIIGVIINSQPTEDKVSISNYEQTVVDSKYIRHALGGYDGHTYLNNIQSLELSYSKGFKLYEVDVSLTSDGRPVLSHGWTESDYKTRLGLPYDPERAVPTYDEFMSFKIQGKYPTSSFGDLVRFMRDHEDMYVMIDTGRKGYDETKKIYETIVDEAESDDSVLQRLIVGGHTIAAVQAVKDTYNFSLYNLYFYTPDNLREEEIRDPLDFIRYCEANNITSVSIAASKYTPEVAETLKQSSLIVYVFTIDDEEEAKRVLSLGATVVGTNFLE